MQRVKLSVMLALGLAMIGCKTKAGDNFQPAVLEDVQSSREAVLQGVRQLFRGRDVTLASDAFKEHSKVLIERRPIKTIDGNLSAGVVADEPQAVQLVTDGQYCYLVRWGTDLSIRLKDVACKPVNP